MTVETALPSEHVYRRPTSLGAVCLRSVPAEVVRAGDARFAPRPQVPRLQLGRGRAGVRA